MMKYFPWRHQTRHKKLFLMVSVLITERGDFKKCWWTSTCKEKSWTCLQTPRGVKDSLPSPVKFLLMLFCYFPLFFFFFFFQENIILPSILLSTEREVRWPLYHFHLKMFKQLSVTLGGPSPMFSASSKPRAGSKANCLHRYLSL